jgi:hypothetical protein
MYPENQEYGQISIASNWLLKTTFKLMLQKKIKKVLMLISLKLMEMRDFRYVLVIKLKWMIGLPPLSCLQAVLFKQLILHLLLLPL